MNLHTQHFHGVPGIELRSLCSGGKHFTDWPTSVALQVPLLGRIRIPMGGGLMSVSKCSRWKNKTFSHLACCSLGGVCSPGGVFPWWYASLVVFPWWNVPLVVCFLGSVFSWCVFPWWCAFLVYVPLVVCSLGSVFPWWCVSLVVCFPGSVFRFCGLGFWFPGAGGEP